MSTAIKLNFISQSNDANNSTVVIFQKNVNTDYDELAVAWKVIENCGRLDNHPFVFPMENQVGIQSMDMGDANSYTSGTINAKNGELYHVVNNSSEKMLSYHGPAASQHQIEVVNELKNEGVNANIYKDGKLLATKTGLPPEQKAVFEFKPTIWVGVASQAIEGQIMNSAIISEVNTELSLLGIQSANIVMTGGGAGSTATPYKFTLENVVKA